MDITAAVSYLKAGRTADAEAVCRRLLALDAADADAAQLLGVVCLRTGRRDEAVDLLRGALRLRPDWAEAYNNLGVALQQREQWVKAENAFRAAVRLKPEYGQAYVNLGNVLRRQDRVVEAVDALRTAVAAAPGDGGAQSALGAALLDLGQLDDAIAQYRRASDLQPDSPAAHSDLLFWLLHAADVDAAALFDEHRRWSARFEQPLRTEREAAFDLARDADRPLRVGYVSPDFREHAVARFFEPVISAHDRRQVTAVCYSDVVHPDGYIARIRAHAAEWRDTATLSHAALASLIRADRIDVLVDLTGHMGGNRLCVFARRPAPVQASYMAYPHSTGLASIDWRITDAVRDPPGATDPYHTERLLRLPGCAFCYRPSERLSVTPLPALASGAVTFGMLNRMAKVTPAAVALWARVLAAVPRSRLLVLAAAGEANAPVRQLFERGGIDGRRLRLAPVAPREDYLRLADEVDIALDPFPYAGMTTTCDFLWMGVPTVTLAGASSVSRTGVSILQTVGLGRFVAGSPDEYVPIAAAAAADLPALSALRASLRGRVAASPLLDGPAAARKLEAAYRAAWRAGCNRRR